MFGISIIIFCAFIILLILYLVQKKKETYTKNQESWNWKIWRVLETKVPAQQDPYAWYQELTVPSFIQEMQLSRNFPRCAYFSITIYSPSHNLCVIASLSGKDIQPSEDHVRNPFQSGSKTLSQDEKIPFEILISNKKSTLHKNVLYIPPSFQNKIFSIVLRYYQFVDKIDTTPQVPMIQYVNYSDSNLQKQFQQWKHPNILFQDFTPHYEIVNTRYFPVNSSCLPWSPQRKIPFFKFRNLPYTNNPCGKNTCTNYLIASLGIYPVYFIKIKTPKVLIQKNYPSTVPQDLDMYYFSISVYGYSKNYGYSVNGTSLWEITDDSGYSHVLIHPDVSSLSGLLPLNKPYDSNLYPKIYPWGKYKCIVLQNSIPNSKIPGLQPFLIVRYKDPVRMKQFFDDIPCVLHSDSYSSEERTSDHAGNIGPPPYTYPQLSYQDNLKNHYQCNPEFLSMYSGTLEEFNQGYIGPIHH